jgi:hypothetical protein
MTPRVVGQELIPPVEIPAVGRPLQQLARQAGCFAQKILVFPGCLRSNFCDPTADLIQPDRRGRYPVKSPSWRCARCGKRVLASYR